MQRVVIPELLDTDTGTQREVEDSLADLRMINRRFGGVRTMAQLILQVANERGIRSLSWLDVAGGRGDVAALTARSLGRHGIELHPVLLDRMPGHMIGPERQGAGVGTEATANGFYPSVSGDALALPFKEESFDIVGCSLFAHHLEPEQLVAFAGQALRVARHAVLINDLVRHRVHLALAYAGYALYRSRLTRHDSVASVRRAYTIEEVEGLLRRTHTGKIEARRFFPFRMGVIAWKKASLI
jgi:ubiquinone/menaquinone biosynthesis C-methylase UbiE